MASRPRPALRSPDVMEPERPPPVLMNELLEEIFLCVASPVDLARASAACVSFRRLIADHSFLRRYRSIHPPLLLGVVSPSGFQPVQAPHPSAVVARAVAFSFDYLPRPNKGYRWYPIDVRDGRVLLQFPKKNDVVHLAVCDPLFQRYLLLPLIADDLLASIGLHESLFHFGASFMPSGGIEEDTSFRVISWIQSKSRLGVFTFSSGSGCWSVSTSISWGDLGFDEISMLNIGYIGQRAYDCFYWRLFDMSTVMKLDMNSMQFSTIDLPPGHDDEWENIIVESEESKAAMFSVCIYYGTSVDYYTFSQNGSEKSHMWHMKNTIPLPDQCTSECHIHGPAEGYIFIEGIQDEEDTTYSVFFSLEIKSFNVEWSVGPVFLLLAPIHILVSHHLCHQGGFNDMERSNG